MQTNRRKFISSALVGGVVFVACVPKASAAIEVEGKKLPAEINASGFVDLSSKSEDQLKELHQPGGVRFLEKLLPEGYFVFVKFYSAGEWSDPAKRAKLLQKLDNESNAPITYVCDAPYGKTEKRIVYFAGKLIDIQKKR